MSDIYHPWDRKVADLINAIKDRMLSVIRSQIHIIIDVFLAVALVVLLLMFFAGDYERDKGPGKAFGTILVDSPEIYTRERLVNDRFREDAWLKSTLCNLKKLSEEKFGFQGITRSQQLDTKTVQLDLHASGQLPSSEGNAIKTGSQGDSSGAKNLGESDHAPSNDDGQPQAQLRDDFRQLLDIRDAIRKEIIENQLDDRHDIGVNTLYKFKFDVTTIVPGKDTSAWAKIRIAITKPDIETLVESLKKRYTEWIQYLETLVNKEFRDRSLEAKAQNTDNINKDFKIRLLDYVKRSDNLFLEPEPPEAQDVIGLLTDKLARPEHDEVDRLFNSIIARLQYRDVIKFHSRRCAMKWLIANWVIFELLERPGLNRFITINIIPLGEEDLRIAVATIRKPPTIPEGFEFEAQEVDREDVDKTSGFAEFMSTFLSKEYEIFTYGVSPKQSVERISDAAAYERSYELLSSLAASRELGNAKAALKLLREQNADIHAIRRNAVIIGFADRHREATREAEAVFGWLIGPRFQVSDDGVGFQYRHIPVQNALAVLVSLPAVWNKVKITVQTSWVKEDGSEQQRKSYAYHVSLPMDVEKLTEAVSSEEYGVGGLKPVLYQSQIDHIYLREGDPAQVLIPGRNLWRSTVVTIGAQPSDRITVLPNMEGIIAHFDKIRAPAWDKHEDQKKLKVRVWTSTGMIPLPQGVFLYRRNRD